MQWLKNLWFRFLVLIGYKKIVEVGNVTILSRREPCRHCGRDYSNGNLKYGCFCETSDITHKIAMCPFCGTPRELPLNK